LAKDKVRDFRIDVKFCLFKGILIENAKEEGKEI